ncbi:hypothetical protein [Rufibacter latericius]|uniref:Uncharacterized protein n=1 Tax=Rufibacter latericius TaxID=2487040 RepID=A0A3M9MU60_9BACT|nr:hypothetical protein [Rufibacter latericius]RNI29039.1 hypothetical protein EFB08_06295 [Rufibacter latericius]
MKRSTILIVAALVLFLGSLTAFNFVMKAEFETGNYKDPLAGFVSQNYTNFQVVEVNGGSKISVKIEQGPYKVFLHNRVQESVQVKQQGNKLVVDVNQKDEAIWSNGRYVVYISCPELTNLTTSARYTLKGKPQVDLFDDNPYGSKIVSIEGFKQDSLSLQQDHGTAVKLVKTKLNNLHAIVGATQGSGSKLFLGKGNQINSAALDIRNKSFLHMNDVVIPSVAYQFSDSARADFTGAALAYLNKK